MNKPVGLGIQDFEKIIENNNFYIDKTRFISEWWRSNDDVTLITRPRRFGKTLLLSTVENFLSLKQVNGGKLFEGLEVSEDAELMKEQGKWPVIFISFATIKENTYEGFLLAVNLLLARLKESYGFLYDSLSEEGKTMYDRINPDMEEQVSSMVINVMSEWLYKYYGKKVIVLLDEYDTPMQEAFVNGYWDEVSGFMRTLFNFGFKANPYMERALMTGITRVSRESMFSDLNNLNVVTISTEQYSDCFGFTESEVFAALEAYGYASEKERVREWYDGFRFGNIDGIYNPWSILSFIKKGKYEPYWANTSSNSLISKLVREGDSSLKELFEELLNGGTIITTIDEQLVFGEMSGNHNALWSLLLSGGYLKILKIEGTGNMAEYTLKLTNYEVRDCFNLLVKRWFENAGKSYNYFIKALVDGNVDDMNDSLMEISESMISSFDGSGKSAPENFYHGLVLGLLVELRDSYEIRSNRESGLGRYDVMLRPKVKDRNAIIIEFKSKRRSEKNKTLDELADMALEQIKDKKYETELLEAGYMQDKIKKYAFAFDGKELLIKEG